MPNQNQYDYQSGQGAPQNSGQTQANYGYTQGQQAYQQGQDAYSYQQQAYQQQSYQQPQDGYPYQQAAYQQQATAPVNNEHMRTGEWIVTYLLMLVPIANIIMPFIWAFGSSAKPSKKTWARAMLIFMAIGLVLSIILAVVVAVLGISLLDLIIEYEEYGVYY